MKEPDGRRVLISGAGIAGLTAAIWLGRAGFRPVVVEKARSIRAGGFLVSLTHHAYRFAEELGLLPALRERDIGIRRSSYHDAAGRTLLELDYERLFRDVEVVQILRDDLAIVLHEEAAKHAEIRFSESIESLADRDLAGENVEGVDVRFASGANERFDLVIGADGLHSRVRELAWRPEEVTQHHLDLGCAAFRLPNVLGIERKFETHMQRDRYCALFTTREQDLGAVFVWAREDHEVPAREERRRTLLDAFEGVGGSIGRVLAECPEDNRFYFDTLSQVEVPCLHRGRVVLVGDAAYCLTLFSGRGAAAAFAGASRLSRELIRHDVPTAFARFEAEMRPIIAELQPATRSAVRWYVPRSTPRQWMRDHGMRWLPNAFFREYFRRKYSRV